MDQRVARAAGRRRTHAHRRRRARAVAAHRLDRAAARRTTRKTYGYLRWEILAALVNGAALFGIAALGRGRGDPADPAPRADSDGTLPRGRRGRAWLVNLRQPRRPARHPATEASTPAGAYLHVLGDALGSVGALAAARSSRSPAGPSPTRSSPSSSRCSSWSAPGGCCARAPTSCSRSVPASRLDGGSAAPDARASPGWRRCTTCTSGR